MFCLVASSSVRDSRATFLRERKRRETTWARYSLEKHAPSAAELGQPTAHLSRYFRTITSQSAIFTSRRPVFLSLYLPLFILLRHKTGQTEQRSNLPKQHSSMCRWPTKGSQTAGERKKKRETGAHLFVGHLMAKITYCVRRAIRWDRVQAGDRSAGGDPLRALYVPVRSTRGKACARHRRTGRERRCDPPSLRPTLKGRCRRAVRPCRPVPDRLRPGRRSTHQSRRPHPPSPSSSLSCNQRKEKKETQTISMLTIVTVHTSDRKKEKNNNIK